MKIFTVAAVIQLYTQVRETTQVFLESLLLAAWQNVTDFFPAFIQALAAKDWSEVLVRLLILVGTVVMVYRLVRKMPLTVLKLVPTDNF
ncbi:MAG TPA: hypothetical protein PKD68_05330 [Candidatus Saccharibacteria bacterium]|nr:hypothetical protein [Candidatus Saccharibacteria bacterium]